MSENGKMQRKRKVSVWLRNSKKWGKGKCNKINMTDSAREGWKRNKEKGK
jgi:hypothetical protein